jgi:WD40 repeat protein
LPRLPRQESSASDGPNFVFSPDGHRFAVMTVDKTVEVYDLSSLRKVEE